MVDEKQNPDEQQPQPLDMDDLTPPPINLSRSSILFDPDPSTKKNKNIALDLWKECKSNFPKIVTGAWGEEDAGDDNPVGALYNLVFVRLPVLFGFGFYLKNNFAGRPLIIDFGTGELVIDIFIASLVVFFSNRSW
eukprot:CAMPEP_0171307996 /NCGR_PEP_ID=MMETSP0816-20121228/18093_1 /TAXON_ID=420281 /ORGANISM="Proboscia inermis, Strain CCAP1064/1" /LENGTH=135 /DNA_ID=CAMNT_0011790589 /DNA_START=168 /DNA_END=572 /DNA_ORIENTATION=+